MTTASYRVEYDTMGALDVPAGALWGAQTQRALQNFPAGGQRKPRAFIRALGLIKHAAAAANGELGDLPEPVAAAVQAAALEVAAGRHDDQFPVDVFQTGSGINARPRFAVLFARHLASRTGIGFLPSENFFEALSCQDTAVELSGQLKVLGVGLLKIANDQRWKSAAIAKKAVADGRPMIEVAAEMTGLAVEDLALLLDPMILTQGGIRDPESSG